MKTFSVGIDSLPTHLSVAHIDSASGSAMHQQAGASPWTFVACPNTISPTASEVYQIVNAQHGIASNLLIVPIHHFSGTESIEWCREVPAQRLISCILGSQWARNLHSGDWVHSALARLRELAGRGDGWKGEGSRAPSESTIDDGKALLDRLRNAGCTSTPMISADDDGEVIFFWKNDDDLLSLAISGDSRYSFFARRSGKSRIGEDVPISRPFPTVVSLLLNEMKG